MKEKFWLQAAPKKLLKTLLPGNFIWEKNFPFSRIRILDWYIVQELFSPFLFGIAVFTVLFMATGPLFDMANLIIQYGVPVLYVFEYAVVRLPSFIAYTLPMSVLLAALMAFSRLSIDHELIAMKAGGISFYRMLIPVFLFAVASTGASYLLNTQIGPESLYRAKVIVAMRATKGQLPPIENIKFSSTTQEGFERIAIARSFNEAKGVMQGPVINDFDKSGNLARITHAEKAIWKNNAWNLVNGESFQMNPAGLSQSRTTFAEAQLDLPHTPMEIGLMERSPEEMPNPLLQKTIFLLDQDPQKDSKQILALRMLYQLRLALPFACLIFTFIGTPSGIRPVRSSSSVGVAMSVLIILIYYFLTAICKSLGEHGTLQPALAAWIPNFLFLGLGILFLAKETT